MNYIKKIEIHPQIKQINFLLSLNLSKKNIPNFDMFKPMLTSGNAQGGVIYSDSNSLEIVFRKGALEYNFAFTHITPRNEKIENIDFSTTNFPNSELLNISISKAKYDKVSQLILKVQIQNTFGEPPLANLYFTLGSRQITCHFNIPCLVNKF